MKFTFADSPVIAAPVSRVWTRLNDPDVVGSAGPGVQRVTVKDPRHFDVVTGLKLGTFRLEFTMHVELYDLVPERELKMRARGKATGSSIEVQSVIRLEPLDEHRTRLHWNATTDIGGIVARIGGHRLEGLARDLTQRFWERFVRESEQPPTDGHA